ncbi:MAG: NUDIX domain-containing protein [Planctomycetota bacterium]
MAYVPKACGFVLVRESPGGAEYLLIVSRKHGEKGLPKGHVDTGETERETARRETREETGLAMLREDPFFRTEIRYPVVRKGRRYQKTAVYFLARTGHEPVVLSDEHTAYVWLHLPDALRSLPHDTLRYVLVQAALHVKDRALFEVFPTTEAIADSHLAVLPEASEPLLGHVRGAAHLARTFACALLEAEKPIHEEAAATGALLHDVGRALGRHQDHQTAGLLHLRATPELGPYGFACISHFTKGAFPAELVQAGVAGDDVQGWQRLVDLTTLTWEEHCVALADACMMRDEVVSPRRRFEDLRRRYEGARALIDLQERRTEAVRRTLEASLGRDPLAAVGLA